MKELIEKLGSMDGSSDVSFLNETKFKENSKKLFSEIYGGFGGSVTIYF